MNRENPLTLLAAWIAFALAPANVIQAADGSTATGTIEGRVFNAATGAALANVRVAVEGSSRDTLTDDGGLFRLTDVPVGRIRISARYLGLDSQTIVVEVPAGGRVQREIELKPPAALRTGDKEEVIQMQRFTVVVDREMSAQAVAMNEQRNAPNLKNVVAIEEFGDRGGENIGEFLQLLPGVSIVTTGIEPDNVSLRGLPSNGTGLTIDGGAVASSRDARVPTLRAVPMANVSRVEVTKVPTPDMPANGLGGSINLITKTGFETRRPQLSYQVYGLFHSSTGLTLEGGPRHHLPQDTARWKQPSFDFSYSHPVNKSLAITVGGSRTWRMRPMESGNDETANWDIISLFQRTSQWTTLVQLNKTLSGQLGLDWRISPTDTLSLSVHQRTWSLPITRSTMIVNYGAGARGGPDFTQGAATGVGTVTQGNNWRVDEFLTKQLTAKYRHRGALWRIDAAGSWSKSRNSTADIDEGTFNNVNSVISNLVIRGEGIPKSGGIIPRRYSAVSRTGAPVDIYSGDLYSIPSGTSNQNTREGIASNARLDLARDFASVVPFSVKVGVSADRIANDAQTDAKTWNFRPNGASDVAARMAGNFAVFDEAFLSSGPTVYGVPYRELSLKKVYELYRQRPEWFVLDDALAYQSKVSGSREFAETVSAAYLRSDFRFFHSRLWIVTGVRFEHTAGEGRGPLDDINAQYQRDASGNYIRNAAGQRVLITSDALALRKLRYQERAASAKQRYNGYYPSFNATYNLSDNLLIRAAYARTIGRPDLNYITPGTTITAPEVANPTITVSNTRLRPWTADNYDLTVESYNFRDGFGVFGVFQKNIRNFFGSRSVQATPDLLDLYSVPNDGSYGNYRIVTMENAGDAKVTGVEFGYRQSLTFLPHWARGLQASFTVTKLKLSGSNTAEFTGFNPSTFSGGVNLLRERFFIKATLSYQGETRRASVDPSVANGIPANAYLYQGKRVRLGITTQYSLSRRYAIYASIMDVGGFDQEQFRYAPGTPDYAKGQRLTKIGTFVTLGIKGTF